MNVSALFPYKPDDGVRDQLWSIVKKRYHHLLPQVELCVGQDESEPFCRARAINRAAEEASGEVLIIVDTDVVFDPGLINRIVALIPTYPWIIPFYSGIKLTSQSTTKLIQEGLPDVISVQPEDIEEIESHAGAFMNVVTREWFKEIGGMDERFQGWGGEDGALVYSLDTLCGPHYRMNETIYHLWHPRAVRVEHNYRRNMDLLLQYQKAAGDHSLMLKIILQQKHSPKFF